MDAKIFKDLSDDEILAAFEITHSQMPNLYFVDVVDNGAVIFWLTKPVPEEAAWRGSPYLMEEIKDLTYYGVAMFHQKIWWDLYDGAATYGAREGRETKAKGSRRGVR